MLPEVGIVLLELLDYRANFKSKYMFGQGSNAIFLLKKFVKLEVFVSKLKASPQQRQLRGITMYVVIHQFYWICRDAFGDE